VIYNTIAPAAETDRRCTAGFIPMPCDQDLSCYCNPLTGYDDSQIVIRTTSMWMPSTALVQFIYSPIFGPSDELQVVR
jgi:hypothetical protein